MARKLKTGKPFMSMLPLPLHAALRRAAEQYAAENGGQVNINREIVRAIYAALHDKMSAADRARVDAALATTV